MPLTPAANDKNRDKELKRRNEDPGSFGVNKPLTASQQKKREAAGGKPTPDQKPAGK